MGSAIGALSLLCLALVTACATSSFERHGDLWRHRGANLEILDPAKEGWSPVEVSGAELAFSKNGEGVIAVRVRCPSGDRTLRNASRDLWLGIPRQGLEVRDIEVQGRPAVETRATSNGTEVRTVVVESDGCIVQVAHAFPSPLPETEVLDRFLESLVLGDGQ